MITFTINGKKVQGQKGCSILDLARRHGIEIPTLCHPGVMEPSATSLQWAVEVEEGNRSRVVISCKYPIKNSITIRTDKELLNNRRLSLVVQRLAELPGLEILQELSWPYGITPDWA